MRGCHCVTPCSFPPLTKTKHKSVLPITHKASAFCICERELRRAYAPTSMCLPRLGGARASKNKECGPAVVHCSCLHTLKIRPPVFMDVLSSGCSNGKTSLCNSDSVTSRQKKRKKKQDKLKLWGKKVQLAFIKCNLNFLIGAESAVGMDSLSSGNQNAFSRQI